MYAVGAVATKEEAIGKNVCDMINFRHDPHPELFVLLEFFNLSFKNILFLTLLT